MSLQSEWDLANTPSFLQRVTVQAVKSAIYMTIESSTVAGHVARKAYGLQVLAAPELEAMDLALGLAADATISAAGSTCSDAQIDAAMASLWNSYAGV